MWLGKYLTFYSILVSIRAQVDKISDHKSRSKRLLSYSLICPSGCVTCSPVSGCVTCTPDLYLILHRDGIRHTGMCVSSCPRGYYGVKNSNYNRCFKCSIHNCDACVSPTYCVTCVAPYISYKGQCINKCPDGLFYETYTKSCLPKVDCAVAEWNEWGACMKQGQSCGFKYGIQTRKRETVQSPSPNGLACPALNEYKACRMQYRYCADIENNNSHLAPTPYNKKHKNIKNRLYLKQKKRERRRRKKCKNKGRVWRHGFCLKKRRRRNYKTIGTIIMPEMLDNDIITLNYMNNNRGRRFPDSYNDLQNTMDNNILQ